MTEPQIEPTPQGDPHREKVRRNVARMEAAGAKPQEIETYIQSEGIAPITPTAPPKRAPSPRGAFLAPLAQGATFGFADEILGGIGGLETKLHGGSYEEGYTAARDKVRRGTADYAEENPKSALALEVAGGLIPAVATVGRSVVGPTARAIRSPLRTAITQGAGYGALSGAGNSEGGLENRAIGAGLGAAGGAVIGGAASKIAGAVAPVVARASQRVLAPVRRAVNSLTDVSDGLMGDFGPTSRALTTVAADAPRGVEIPVIPANAQRLADRRTLEALQRDEVPIQRLSNEAAGVARTGRGTDRVLADMGGKNVQGLGRAAQAVPSKGKESLSQMLTRRQKKQLPAIGAAMEKGAGVERQNVVQTVEDLITKRQTESRPLYEKAYPVVVDDPEVLATIAGSPMFTEAHALGRALAHEEGRVIPPITRTVEVGGQQVTEQVPQTVESIDYMKRGLDALIERKSGAGGAMDRDMARVLRKKLNGLLTRVDELVPDYGAARAAFRGPSEVKDAVEVGREFLKQDPREVAGTLKGYTDAETEGFRIGALDAARQLMEKVASTGDMAPKVMGNPAIRAKIRNLFPDEKSYFGYLREVLDRARMSRTKRNILGGSETADKLSEIADLTGVNLGELATEAAAAVQTGGASIALKAAKEYLARQTAGVRGNVADQIARNLLTKPSDPAFAALLERLTAAEREQLLKAAGSTTAARVGGNLAGAATGPQ